MGIDSSKLDTMSIRDLKKLLARLGLDASGCLEKRDLVKRLQESLPEGAASSVAEDAASRQPPPTPASPCADAGRAPRAQARQALAGLPVAELRGLLKCHGAEDAVMGATEKTELIDALAMRLSTCPICLDDAEEDATGLAESFQRCDTCRAPFHRQCAGGHALSAAEAGRLPLLCPVLGCHGRWRAGIVAWALDEGQLTRYNTAVRSLRDLRRSAGSTDATTSPRMTEELKGLGVRKCPKCGALIEKQQPGFTHGCDKMTCRCGCRFCFRCGMLADPSGRARCQCVGEHHSYLSHETVLRNYDSDGFAAFGGPRHDFHVPPGGVPGPHGLMDFVGQAVGAAFQAAAAGRGGGGTNSTPTGGMEDFLGQAMRAVRQASGGEAGIPTFQPFR